MYTLRIYETGSFGTLIEIPIIQSRSKYTSFTKLAIDFLNRIAMPPLGLPVKIPVLRSVVATPDPWNKCDMLLIVLRSCLHNRVSCRSTISNRSKRVGRVTFLNPLVLNDPILRWDFNCMVSDMFISWQLACYPYLINILRDTVLDFDYAIYLQTIKE